MKVIFTVTLLTLSSSVFAWGNNHYYGGAKASASQWASGGNNASAASFTTGNGYSHNAAGSTTSVGGATNAYAGYGRHGYRSGASAYDTKSVDTWSFSRNRGNASGFGYASGYAFGGAREYSSAWD